MESGLVCNKPAEVEMCNCNIEENNISHILVPFEYTGKKGLSEYVKSSGLFGTIEKVSKDADCTDGLINYILDLYEHITSFSIKNVVKNPNMKIYLHCFDTGIGFLDVEMNFVNTIQGTQMNPLVMGKTILKIIHVLEERASGTVDSGYLERIHILEKKTPVTEDSNYTEESHKIKGWMNKVEGGKVIRFFPLGKTGNSITYNTYFSGDEEEIFGDKFKEYRMYTNNHGRCSKKTLTMRTIVNIQDLEDRTEEQEDVKRFRKQYRKMFWLYLLIQHERIASMIYRGNVISKGTIAHKRIKDINQKIVDLRTCYSFKSVSDDEDIQKLYSLCREMEGLDDYERDLDDLIIRVDNEIAKKGENGLTIFTIVISLLGLFQLASVILDFYQFLVK